MEQKEKGNMHSIINRKEIYNKYKENIQFNAILYLFYI